MFDRVDNAMFVWARVEFYGFKNRSIFPQTKTAGSSLQKVNLLVLTNSDGAALAPLLGAEQQCWVAAEAGDRKQTGTPSSHNLYLWDEKRVIFKGCERMTEL